MPTVKERLIAKIKTVDGFGDARVELLHKQPSIKIVDIPRWFYGHIGCHSTMTECVKVNNKLLFSEGHESRYDEFYIE